MEGPLNPVEAAARALLGRTITAHDVTVRLTEVEAYAGPDDPASHAVTRTPRSEVMHGEPGRLYVYRSYGLHFCANVVTGPVGVPGAVLLRAGEVVAGIEVARARRGRGEGWPDVRLASGPGNLGAALGFTLADNGDVARLGPEVRTASAIRTGPRVGVAKAADVAWRFWLPSEPSVSAYRRSPRAH